ncbi:glycosyltransferase [Pleurocapsales cyanobacterium LEGE 06147]|nr:glycosyltransferase [Pleurocapsales cyanobacterium LEGE 06147]
MSNEPLVTVLMSVYNGLPYLQQALESILQQTYDNFEFLIIDDGSTDGSDRLLSEYARRDYRIKILSNEQNYGLSYSLARGLLIATTPWIARMDADDVALPNRLELQMTYIQENPHVDIVGGYALDIDEGDRVLGERKVPTIHEEILRLIWTNPFIHGTVLFRRESILKIGSYSRQLAKRQDYELWFRCAVAGVQFANLPVPLIYYRFTDNTFKRNNWKVALTHVLIGWRGCWMVEASPFAYLAVTKQLALCLLPSPLRTVVYLRLKQFDPRSKAK